MKNISVEYFSKYYDTRYGKQYSHLLNNGEHYKLLTYLSNRLKPGSTVIDAGTNQGHSALALGQNRHVEVLSYDIKQVNTVFGIHYPNIKLVNKNVLTLDKETILKSKIILIDIDPHEGMQESLFLGMLIKINYKGILIVDDINLNDGMRYAWNHLCKYSCEMLKTYDITKFGHWTGTGLVLFNPDEEITTICGELLDE